MKEKYWDKITKIIDTPNSDFFVDMTSEEIKSHWLEEQTKENGCLYLDLILDYLLNDKNKGRYLEDSRGNAGWVFYNDMSEDDIRAYSQLFQATKQFAGEVAAKQIFANWKARFLDSALSIRKAKTKDMKELTGWTENVFEDFWRFIPKSLVVLLTVKELALLLELLQENYRQGKEWIADTEAVENLDIVLLFPLWFFYLPAWADRFTNRETMQLIDLMADTTQYGIAQPVSNEAHKYPVKEVYEKAIELMKDYKHVVIKVGMICKGLADYFKKPFTGVEECVEWCQLLQGQQLSFSSRQVVNDTYKEIVELKKRVEALPQNYKMVEHLSKVIEREYERDINILKYLL